MGFLLCVRHLYVIQIHRWKTQLQSIGETEAKRKESSSYEIRPCTWAACDFRGKKFPPMKVVLNWVLQNGQINVDGKPGKKQHTSQTVCRPQVFGETEMAQYSQYVKCSVGRGQVEDRQEWRWDRVLIIEDFVNKTLPTQFIWRQPSPCRILSCLREGSDFHIRNVTLAALWRMGRYSEKWDNQKGASYDKWASDTKVMNYIGDPEG